MKLLSFDGKLMFDNGTTIEDEHDQDCCEHVYSDFSQLDCTDVLIHEFPDEVKIEGVKNAGFRLDGYFIPCYNSQNGYYGSDLALIIKYPDKREVKIDISNFVEDQIY